MRCSERMGTALEWGGGASGGFDRKAITKALLVVIEASAFQKIRFVELRVSV
jgi:hypothetical protein